jgi:hypothetical protein
VKQLLNIAKWSAIEDCKAERKCVADCKACGLKSHIVVLQYKAHKSSDDDNKNELI